MRSFFGVVLGLITWVVIATVVNLALRYGFPGYAAVEHDMRFTLGMMLARLALPGAVPSLAAGFACATIAPRKPRAVWVLACLLLLVFLPSHYYLRDKFPIWYHLTFLSSLPILTWCGSKLREARLAR
jgi:hypothetical protein